MTEHGESHLDWVDPETGEILYDNLGRADFLKKGDTLDGVPVLFVSEKDHRNGYRLLDFLVFEKLVQVLLHEEQDFGDYFTKAT